MSRVRQHPLLVFLIQMTQSILLREIAYLKAENTILRSRCPKQIQTTPAERSLLVRLDSVDTRLTKVKNCVKKQGNHGTISRNTSIQTARFE
jgi:hypothetical protein